MSPSARSMLLCVCVLTASVEHKKLTINDEELSQLIKAISINYKQATKNEKTELIKKLQELRKRLIVNDELAEASNVVHYIHRPLVKPHHRPMLQSTIGNKHQHVRTNMKNSNGRHNMPHLNVLKQQKLQPYTHVKRPIINIQQDHLAPIITQTVRTQIIHPTDKTHTDSTHIISNQHGYKSSNKPKGHINKYHHDKKVKTHSSDREIVVYNKHDDIRYTNNDKSHNDYGPPRIKGYHKTSNSILTHYGPSYTSEVTFDPLILFKRMAHRIRKILYKKYNLFGDTVVYESDKPKSKCRCVSQDMVIGLALTGVTAAILSAYSAYLSANSALTRNPKFEKLAILNSLKSLIENACLTVADLTDYSMTNNGTQTYDSHTMMTHISALKRLVNTTALVMRTFTHHDVMSSVFHSFAKLGNPLTQTLLKDVNQTDNMRYSKMSRNARLNEEQKKQTHKKIDTNKMQKQKISSDKRYGQMNSDSQLYHRVRVRSTLHILHALITKGFPDYVKFMLYNHECKCVTVNPGSMLLISIPIITIILSSGILGYTMLQTNGYSAFGRRKRFVQEAVGVDSNGIDCETMNTSQQCSLFKLCQLKSRLDSYEDERTRLTVGLLSLPSAWLFSRENGAHLRDYCPALTSSTPSDCLPGTVRHT